MRRSCPERDVERSYVSFGCHSRRESASLPNIRNLLRCPHVEREYDFWVYILASRSRTLYIGITNGLTRRTTEHRNLVPGSFTARYGIFRLVYFEDHQYVLNAIMREKQLKKWTRAQKIALIQEFNPTWEDLFLQFGQKIVPSLNGKQIPFGNDNQRVESNDVSAPGFVEGSGE